MTFSFGVFIVHESTYTQLLLLTQIVMENSNYNVSKLIKEPD
jgi:hypothetical protein